MRSVTFDEYRLEAGSLWLSGPESQARLEAYRGGYWRLLVWHRQRNAAKKSWVLERPQQLPVELVEDVPELRLRAEGAELTLRLSPFAIAWEGLELAELQVGEPPTWITDAAAVAEAVAGVGGEREVEDGQPFGAGYALHLREGPQRRPFLSRKPVRSPRPK